MKFQPFQLHSTNGTTISYDLILNDIILLLINPLMFVNVQTTLLILRQGDSLHLLQQRFLFLGPRYFKPEFLRILLTLQQKCLFLRIGKTTVYLFQPGLLFLGQRNLVRVMHGIFFLLEQFQILLFLGIRRHTILLAQHLLLGIARIDHPKILHIFILQLGQFMPDIQDTVINLPVAFPGIAHYLQCLLLRIQFTLSDRILLNVQIPHENGTSLLLLLSVYACSLLCSVSSRTADMDHLILVRICSDLHEL